MDEWEDIGEPGNETSIKITIECSLGAPEPDPLTMWVCASGAVGLSAVVIWLIVRFINRRSLRRLPLNPP